MYNVYKNPMGVPLISWKKKWAQAQAKAILLIVVTVGLWWRMTLFVVKYIKRYEKIEILRNVKQNVNVT